MQVVGKSTAGFHNDANATWLSPGLGLFARASSEQAKWLLSQQITARKTRKKHMYGEFTNANSMSRTKSNLKRKAME